MISYTAQQSLIIHVVITGLCLQPVLGNREAEAQTPRRISSSETATKGGKFLPRGCQISQEEHGIKGVITLSIT